MDRSDFYYRQIVTQAEMDQAFDDPEAAIRAITGDYDLQVGVAAGMEVQETSPVSGSVEVTTGAAYDSQGRRVPVLTLGTIDLSSLMPDINPRYVRIYAEFGRTMSDPRLDGNNDPVDYRQTEEAVLSYVAGVAAGSPVKPTIDPTKVLLATILIGDGNTTITDSDISMSTDLSNGGVDPDRQECGVLIHRGRMIGDDLYFDETEDLAIKGIYRLYLKAGSAGFLGADFGDRYLTNIGRIYMGQNDIVGVDQLVMDSGGGSDPAIDMNGRNIGEIGVLDDVSEIQMASTGPSSCIDTNGRNIVTEGGSIDTTGGNLSNVGSVSGVGGVDVSGFRDGSFSRDLDCGTLTATDSVDTTNGPVRANGATGEVVAAQDVKAAGEVIADSGGSGSGDFKFGASRSYFTYLRPADFTPFNDAYGIPANLIRDIHWIRALAAGTYVLHAPINFPDGALLANLVAKLNQAAASSITVELFRINHNLGNPTTNPSYSSLAQINPVAPTGSWTSAAASFTHTVNLSLYTYMVWIALTQVDDYVGPIRVEYGLDEFRSRNVQKI